MKRSHLQASRRRLSSWEDGTAIEEVGDEAKAVSRLIVRKKKAAASERDKALTM